MLFFSVFFLRQSSVFLRYVSAVFVQVKFFFLYTSLPQVVCEKGLPLLLLMCLLSIILSMYLVI